MKNFVFYSFLLVLALSACESKSKQYFEQQRKEKLAEKEAMESSDSARTNPLDVEFENLSLTISEFISAYGDRKLGSYTWRSEKESDAHHPWIRLSAPIGNALIIEMRPDNHPKKRVYGLLLRRTFLSDSSTQYFFETSLFENDKEVTKERAELQITTPEEMNEVKKIFISRIKEAEKARSEKIKKIQKMADI